MISAILGRYMWTVAPGVYCCDSKHVGQLILDEISEQKQNLNWDGPVLVSLAETDSGEESGLLVCDHSWL
jgi:hypothetical protein